MLDLNTAELSVRKAAATDALSSADLLTSLSHDPDCEVRRAVVGNPNTPTEVLLNLGKEFPDEITANSIFNILLLEDPESLFVRLSLARSSMLSEAALTQLSSISDEEILCAIAQNPVTPLSILETLVHHPPQLYEDSDWSDYDRIFASVAKSPNVSVELLTELVERGSGVCYAIAKNPKTPQKILEKFATWRNYDMQQALLQNPKTPASVLEILAGENHPKIEAGVKAHPNVSETAIKIANFVRQRSGTPIEILEKLASDHRSEIRYLVAEYPQTPPSALKTLALDPDRKIRLLVALHPNLSSEALENLTQHLVPEYLEWLKFSMACDRSWGNTFLAIMKLPHLTAKMLESFANVTDAEKPQDYMMFQLIDMVAQHKKTPGVALIKLAHYYRNRAANYEGRCPLIYNPNTPAEALEILIRELLSGKWPYSLSNLYKYLVHPNVSTDLLAELANHDSPSVRAALAKLKL